MYDPLKDDNLTLEQITKLINEKNEEIKVAFKQFCDAPSDEKEALQLKLKNTKN